METMHRPPLHTPLLFFFFFFFSVLYLSFTPFNVCLADGKPSESAGENPFTAKASLIRYWNRQISNNLPKPPFLLSKASPLSAVDSAVLCKLASQNGLSSHLSSFCTAAKLFCAFDSDSEPSSGRTQANDANFAVYSNRGFANYGGSRIGGVDSFKNYSDGLNMPNGSFRKYSGGQSKGHREEFTSYARDGNIATGSFAGYGTGASGGSGEFTTYDPEVNVPHREFTTYDSNGDNHKLSFSAYAGDTNSGAESFTSYGKNGKNVPAEFTNYGDGSNIIGSTFTVYGQLANAQNDSFKGYGHSSNNPQNNFKSYGLAGNAAADTFTNYRDGANVGDDSFNSYARSSTAAKVNFANYGRTFNVGNDTFKEYGKGSTKSSVDFKIYGLNYTFKDYEKKGVTFSVYSHASGSSRRNGTGSDTASGSSRRNGTGSDTASGISVNRWVEPGKFFRESMLKKGNVMAMPDIHDRMPGRSFLPRAIVSKLPFSSSGLQELKDIFHARDNSTTERVIANALEECEREPSRGETKRCVGSLEDMIDFAVAVLGRDVVVRTTETARGSKERVMIGEVRGINGGKVTRSVSCHQSLYPYLLYYCHSVPKVRVYDVDIYDVAGKEKMNHGVAICHIDTSSWGPRHGAFVALGSSPGLIEVCHWIFENDMTWTISDSHSH